MRSFFFTGRLLWFFWIISIILGLCVSSMENIDDFASSSWSFVRLHRCLFAWRKKLLCICCWFSIIKQIAKKITVESPCWLCIYKLDCKLYANLEHTLAIPIFFWEGLWPWQKSSFEKSLMRNSALNFGLRKSTVVYSIQQAPCLRILIW